MNNLLPRHFVADSILICDFVNISSYNRSTPHFLTASVLIAHEYDVKNQQIRIRRSRSRSRTRCKIQQISNMSCTRRVFKYYLGQMLEAIFEDSDAMCVFYCNNIKHKTKRNTIACDLEGR